MTSPKGWVAPAAIGAVAVALVGFFDTATRVAFNDEFVYAWAAGRLVGLHRLQLHPEATPIAVVQVVWGAAATFGHPDLRLLRLTAIPFMLLAAFAVYRLARELGAESLWAAVAAAALMASPLFDSVSTAFMTEPFYVGLLLATALAATRWLREGRGVVLLVVLGGLSVLERQHAVGIPVAVTVAAVARWRGGMALRRLLPGIVLTWAVVIAGLVAPVLLGIATPEMRYGAAQLRGVDRVRVLAAALYLPATVGIVLLPLLPVLFGPGARGRRWPPSPLTLGVAGVWVTVTVLATHILPGNYLSVLGLGPPTIPGTKPELFDAVLPVLQGLGLVAFVLLIVRAPGDWAAALRRPEVLLLVVLAATQLLPMVQFITLDRYYLPVSALLLPVAASLAPVGRWPRPAAAWALGVLAAGVAMYTVGEQDYQAWQVARSAAAALAYALAPADRVASGYEVFGTDVTDPLYERTGAVPIHPASTSFSLTGPERPLYGLFFAAPNDPRPGISYRSLAPGKVVVVDLGGDAQPP